MSVLFKTPDGREGILDVVSHLRSQGLLPIKADQGMIHFTTKDGREGIFSLADWAVENNVSVTKIDGFNSPTTALTVPPEGMNALDQLVFATSGKNVDALRGVYPQVKELTDGTVVVLDNDGIWRTMWSQEWQAPEGAPSYEERVEVGAALDINMGMRMAGLAFLFGLAGIEPKGDKNDEVTPKEVGKMLKTLKNNLPIESRIMISKIVEQTIGIDKWKFQAALINPLTVEIWLDKMRKKTSMQIRMEEANLAEILISAMHELSKDEFIRYMEMLQKSPTTKKFLCNMKEPIGEFIQVLIQMDVITDISKITGLDEWKDMAKKGLDESKLPPMPDFVPKLVNLLQWIMPIYERKELMIVRGVQGLKAVTTLMVLIDDAMFSLKNVPESSAKQKMFMVLKTLQAKLESKMSYYYHPMDDKTGTKVNEFMSIKALYSEKREIVYKIVQIPKETWTKHLMDTFQELPNLEAFYGILPEGMADLIQAFIGMDIAYDMQPCVDSQYQLRLHDPFAMFTEEFGAPPPESGYLAKNSPRAALNIIETLSIMSGMLLGMDERQRKQILRSPTLLAKALKNMQTASIQREVGAVEALSKSGLMHMDDSMHSPDPTRIWEDPDQVEMDIHKQMMEQLQQIQQERMAQRLQTLESEKQAQANQQPPQKGQKGQQAQPTEGDNAPAIESEGA